MINKIANTASATRLRPVLQGPRCKWRIPRMDEYARAVCEKQANDQRAKLFEGTCPHGREIFLKIIFRAERIFQEDRSFEKMRDSVEKDLVHYEDARQDIIAVFGVVSRISVEKLNFFVGLPLILATLIAIFLRLQLTRGELDR